MSLVPCGAEIPKHTVRIADAIGDDAVRGVALLLAFSGSGKWEIQQTRVTVDEGLKGLREKRYELVLARVSELPEKYGAVREDYAVEGAMIALHGDNAVNDLSCRELAEIFSGWRKSWRTVNGKEFQIHLMKEPDGAFAVEIFRRKIMGKQSFAPAYERQNFMELLELTKIQEHAATLMPRPDIELPDGMRAVAVDHVYPSLENLRNGRYPLTDRRTALHGKELSPDAGLFLKQLRNAAKILAQYGLIAL